MSAPSLPLASISLDLDDLWTYLRTVGDPSWTSRPSYLADFIPFVLDELDRAQLSLTFFVVGADAATSRNRPMLRAIVERGHEIGNHSFEHQPYFHAFSRERAVAEVVQTQEAIADATGVRPIGFRGPGYSWSPELLEILVEQGYLYDASTLPTFVGPLARAYYFRSSGLTAKERSERRELFGSFRDGLRPVKPYWWELSGGRKLLELPVTTLPVLKLPFHLTYLHYLSRVADPLAFAYLRAGLGACRLTRTPTSIILHPLDLFGGDRDARLKFFPGMDLPTSRKTELFRRTIAIYQQSFSLVPMSVHAQALASGAGLALRRPDMVPARASLVEG